MSWRNANYPPAALASLLTDALNADPIGVSFAGLCEEFAGTEDATPGDVAEALALAYLCRQVVPENGIWRASRVSDFVLAETGKLPS